MYIHWNDEYKIGNELIDAEHKMLVMLIKKLHFAIKKEIPKAQLMRVLLELKKFTEFHFISEENLMNEVRFPGFAEHEKIHSHLLAQLDVVGGRINHGLADPEETLDFLWSWLENHIEEEDRKIGRYLQQTRQNTLSQEAFSHIFPAAD